MFADNLVAQNGRHGGGAEVAEERSLGRFSIGVGDRFAHQARAQLTACKRAAEAGMQVVPVWNKSNREHKIIGSSPQETRAAADRAVRELGWTAAYFCDADHQPRDRQRFLGALRLLHHRCCRPDRHCRKRR
jgi:hypothetical protein